MGLLTKSAPGAPLPTPADLTQLRAEHFAVCDATRERLARIRGDRQQLAASLLELERAAREATQALEDAEAAKIVGRRADVASARAALEHATAPVDAARRQLQLHDQAIALLEREAGEQERAAIVSFRAAARPLHELAVRGIAAALAQLAAANAAEDVVREACNSPGRTVLPNCMYGGRDRAGYFEPFGADELRRWAREARDAGYAVPED